jgi:hypothetical protein
MLTRVQATTRCVPETFLRLLALVVLEALVETDVWLVLGAEPVALEEEGLAHKAAAVSRLSISSDWRSAAGWGRAAFGRWRGGRLDGGHEAGRARSRSLAIFRWRLVLGQVRVMSVVNGV